jgi:hypothetical protein
MAWNLYDFIDPRGQSVIADWLVTERITKRDIGQLNQKLDMLAINGPSLPPKLLAGPIGKTKHIYKLVIHGDLMLRPMLCKGPFEMEEEYTLLLGAIERNWKLDHEASEALTNRETLLASPNRRRNHVRYR